MEEWRDVPEWEEYYEVSSYGRLRSKECVRVFRLPQGDYEKVVPAKLWKLNKPNKQGYHHFVGHAPGRKRQQIRLNILVARVFLGEPPPGTKCDHIDRNPANNRVENLRYITQSENCFNSDRCEKASNVYFRARSPGSFCVWTPKVVVRNKLMNLGSFESRDTAMWVAAFFKKYRDIFT